jgi:hypothetical protein
VNKTNGNMTDLQINQFLRVVVPVYRGIDSWSGDGIWNYVLSCTFRRVSSSYLTRIILNKPFFLFAAYPRLEKN